MAQNEIELADWQVNMIRWALEMQQHALLQHAKTMDQCEKTGGNAMITPTAAGLMAEKHRNDAMDCDQIVQLLEGCDAVFVQREERE